LYLCPAHTSFTLPNSTNITLVPAPILKDVYTSITSAIQNLLQQTYLGKRGLQKNSRHWRKQNNFSLR